jgi:hypothetical protein
MSGILVIAQTDAQHIRSGANGGECVNLAFRGKNTSRSRSKALLFAKRLWVSDDTVVMIMGQFVSLLQDYAFVLSAVE